MLPHTLILLLGFLIPGNLSLPHKTGTRPNPFPQKYSHVVAFGDSWTDTGNTYKLTNGTWPLVPPYHQGRFSDGPVWSEYLAKALKARLINQAYGGATTNSSLVQGYTGANSTIPVPSVSTQLTTHLALPNLPPPSAPRPGQPAGRAREAHGG
ncbi:hypothetical protein HK097_011526, partial [Rhizophlyctis rosea]